MRKLTGIRSFRERNLITTWNRRHLHLLISFEFIFEYYTSVIRSDDENIDEVDDSVIQNIIIVAQTPPVHRKHPGGDRTGAFISKSKMSVENARIINEGLWNYEQEILFNNFKVIRVDDR